MLFFYIILQIFFQVNILKNYLYKNKILLFYKIYLKN